MADFKTTTLWQRTFDKDFLEHKKPVDHLIGVLERTRDNAAVLVQEIAIDLPTYTVHDVSHLDALWEISGQIVGSDVELNPVEGFILGCAFLLHDSAMSIAAYPGGVTQIRQERDFQKLKSQISAIRDEEVEERELLEIFLREQHAIRAEKLPSISWKSERGHQYLIDDASAREKFGDFIGIVAASHWWDHRMLEERLADQRVPVPSPFPSAWSIDLLKLACILRTADAAQIDERRAPSFLKALRRSRLSPYSNDHWTFQNKLSQAQLRNEELFFAGLRPFQKDESQAWRLMFDTLQMIDKELRQTNALLARARGPGEMFPARRVANIDSPLSLQTSVPTSGWMPVDTAFTIPDIPELVAKLGGGQLYGNSKFVAVRELIQNGMDAARLRNIVDPNAPEPKVVVEVSHTSESVVLRISDNGVGMGEAELTDNLLGFGSSGWLHDRSFGEYSDVFANGSAFSGRYGIGFFSCFMLGKKISVRSRRFDGSPNSTLCLEFKNGPKERPILFMAERQDRMTVGGTEISIELDVDDFGIQASIAGYSTSFWQPGKAGQDALYESLSLNFPTCDVLIEMRAANSTTTIDGRNWATESAEALLRRVEGPAYSSNHKEIERAVMPILDDGKVVGRACLLPYSFTTSRNPMFNADLGVIVSKGASVEHARFRGVMLGYPTRVSRDKASLIASTEALTTWASEQARIWSEIDAGNTDDTGLAESVASLGGELHSLKICEIGDKYLDQFEVCEFLKDLDEIWITSDDIIIRERPVGVFSKRASSTIAASDSTRIDLGHGFKSYTLGQYVDALIMREFNIDAGVREAMFVKISDSMSTMLQSDVPAWELENGDTSFVKGRYYKRNMSLKEMKAAHS